MLCPIKDNSNTIELTVHTSCNCVLDTVLLLNTGLVRQTGRDCIFSSKISVREKHPEVKKQQLVSVTLLISKNLMFVFIKERLQIIRKIGRQDDRAV